MSPFDPSDYNDSMTSQITTFSTDHPQFQVRFDGEAVSTHTMDVRDLAPALLSLSNLIDESGRLLYGSNFEVNVHVKNVGDGCFVTDLAVLSQPMVDWLTTDSAGAISNLLAYIGAAAYVGKKSAESLISLINRFGGKAPGSVIEDEATGMATVEFEGETIEVPNEVMRLYRDLPVRRALGNVVEPLEKPGIDSITFSDHDAKPRSTIRRTDRAAFYPPQPEEQEILRERRRMAFSIVSLAFQDDNKWRLNDGNTTIYASIRDANFMREVETNQRRFAKDDVLLCDVEVVQKQGEKGLSIEYIVHEVLEHKQAMRQMPLSNLSDPKDT